MISLFVGICILVISLLVLFILWPWLEHQLNKGDSSPDELIQYQQLIQEREFLLENLKELELDFQLEKIEPSDYERLKASLFSKTAQVFEEIEKWEKNSALFQQVSREAEGSV